MKTHYSLHKASILAMFALIFACASRADEPQQTSSKPSSTKGKTVMTKIVKSEAEWKKDLDAEEYHVLREKGTERAFTGKYWDNHRKGVYKCAACGLELFTSDAKFESGTGWPSFWQPVTSENVEVETDRSHGMVRTEAKCARCGGHLGHVFEDGPKPTGLRYCMNSVSMEFVEKK